jgi:ribonuclease Z
VDVSSLLTGFSKALYSNWLLYRPDNLLIDCGEGCATALGNGIYAVERILLTHGHIDHIGGLPSFIWARASAMGDTEKPLEIVHPVGDTYIADMREFLEKAKARLPFPLTWTPLGAGDTFELAQHGRHPRQVQTFATRHIHGRLTIGYKIVERRRRLKPEFAALSQQEIRLKAQQLKAQQLEGQQLKTMQCGMDGSQDLSEEYDAILAAFGGDGLALNPEAVRGAELLVHEATIIDATDRKQQLHSTVHEALGVGAAANVKTLLINHVSGRYRSDEVKEAIIAGATELSFDGSVWCLVRHRLQPVYPVIKELR